MNRNLRPLLIFVALITVMAVSVTTIGSTIRSVHAADLKQIAQAGESTSEPPTGDAPTVDQPTDVPTDVPATDQPTDVPTDVAVTDQPTDVPTDATVTDQPADVTPTPESTADAGVEVTAEATDVPVEPETTATLAPEETLEPEVTLAPEETLEPEVTETPTAALPEFTVAISCKETGLTFEITNVGVDMEIESSFTLTLDDAANAAAPIPPANLTASTFPVAFTLKSGESTNVEAGYGVPQLIVAGVLYTPDAPCVPLAPPVLTVTAICTFETGVTFTIANSGGAMSAEQGYTIALSNGTAIDDVFQLDVNETATFEAGYGQPTFTSADLVSTTEKPCYAPVTISGTVWNDADGNAVRDVSEIGIADVSVNLIDADGVVKTAVTAADGSYSFANLHAANYIIKIDTATISNDYMLSFPIDNGVLLNAVDLINIVDFGYMPKPTGAITGTVWLDNTNYGVHDAGETGVSGAVVELVDNAGQVVAVAPVDAASGTYVFTAVAAGNYTVRLKQATLFTPNGVTWNSDEKFDYETNISLTTEQVLTNIDFGLAGTY